SHEVVRSSSHLHMHQVRHPPLVRTRRFLILRSSSLRSSPPGANQVRFLQNPVHRRATQTSHVLVHHPPRQFPMPQLRVTPRVGQHRLLLLRQRLIRLHRLDRRRRQRLGPCFLFEPAVVRPPRNSQRRQRPPRRPAA